MADHMDSKSCSEDEEKYPETSTKPIKRVRKQCYMHIASIKHEQEQDFTSTRWNTYREALRKWLGLLHGESRALADSYQHCRDIDFDNIPEDAAFHPTCYRRFIDKRRIEQAEKRIAREEIKTENTEELEDVPLSVPSTKEPPKKKLRSRSGQPSPCAGPVLPALCIICKKADKYITVLGKRQKAHLVQAETTSAGQLQKAAKLKQDDGILLHIKDKDCVSLEVRYHKCCYGQYTIFLTRSTTTTDKQKNEPSFDVGYKIFCERIIHQRLIVNQEVLRMNQLRMFFSDLVKKHEGLDASNYRQDTLKRRLTHDFPQLVFLAPSKRNICELVFVEMLSTENQIDGLHILSGTDATLSCKMEDYHKPDQQTVQALRNVATRLRINSIKATTAAGSGHPTSCCSAAEIMSVLFFHSMKYRPEDLRNPNNDRFILSKGHAAPVLYAVWAEVGYLKENELLNLRKVDSILEGHPVPKQQFVDVATGSLGQGLGAACGMAYTGKYFDKASYRVFCLLGDGELSEGSVWEAMAFASYYQLDNLVAILDINRLGQSDPAPLQHHVEKYQRRCEAFGWHSIIVDGHSVEELCKVLSQPCHQPLAVIAKTIKGKGIPAAEDKMGWHGKPLPKDMSESVIRELQSRIISCNKRLYPAPPNEDASPVSLRNIRMPSAPNYKPGDKIATRKAYGVALAKLGRYNEHVVVLDGDTKNSTFSELFKNEHPNRYVECYIAEQNMVSVAIGCAVRDRNVVFASTFATFFSRAYDQLRMAAISESNINLCGSHCGVSIGEDGPSQMGLEDLAMFRAIPTATVFYPSDGVSTEKAVELAAMTKGLCFIRTSRPENNVIYNCNEDFHVGQAKVVYKTNDDHVTVIGAGVTLHEALAAAEILKKERINIRVIDPFTIKPLDSKTIIDSARVTRGRIITVEDHYYEGGLGEAVCSAVVNETGFTVHRLAVSQVPRSGKPHELLRIFGIDRDSITQAVRKMLSSSANAK